MRSWRPFVLAVAGVLALRVSCSGQGGSAPPDDAVCDSLLEIHTACGTLSEGWESLERGMCSAFLGSLKEYAGRGYVEVDWTALDACLAAWQGGHGCPFILMIPSDCPGFITGLVDQGGACMIDAECVSGSYCQTKDCAGTCVPRLKVGSQCPFLTLGADPCEAGAVCWKSRCMLGSTEGGTCGLEQPCVAGTTCVTGTCIATPPMYGGPRYCPRADGKTYALCPSYQVCDETAHECVPIPEAHAGDVCQKDRTCAPSMRCIEGQCAAGVQPGGSCDTGKDDCAIGTNCATATKKCTPYYSIENGQPCPAGIYCRSGICLEGTCTDPAVAPHNSQAFCLAG